MESQTAALKSMMWSLSFILSTRGSYQRVYRGMLWLVFKIIMAAMWRMDSGRVRDRQRDHGEWSENDSVLK